MTRRRKIWTIIGASVLGVLLVGGLVGWTLRSAIVRRVLLGEIRKNLECEVTVGDVEVHGASGITLTELTITDPADNHREVVYVERLEARLAGIPWPWAEERHITLVKVDRPRITAVRAADGMINFVRMRKVTEPSTVKNLLGHVEVHEADLRFVDLASPAAVAADGTASPRAARVQGLTFVLDPTDDTGNEHRLTVNLADPTWGPLKIEGAASLSKLTAALAMTEGGLHLNARTLGTLPTAPADLLTSLDPTATVRLKEFRTDGTRRGSAATVELVDLGVTPPRAPRLDGVTVTATLKDDVLAVAVRDVPAITQKGLGAIGDVEADLTLDLGRGRMELSIPKASILSGSVQGKVIVPDFRAAQPTPEGEIRVTGIRLPSDAAGTFRSLVAVDDGLLAFHETAGKLVATFRATVAVSKIEADDGAAGRETTVPLVTLPVTADVSTELRRAASPVDFALHLGSGDQPIQMDLAGALRRADNTLVFRKSTGRIDLVKELFKAAMVLRPEAEYAEQFQLSGHLAFDVAEGTELPLAKPQAVAGSIAITSNDLSFLMPGEEQMEKAKLVVSLASSDDPVARYQAKVRADLLASRGVISATAALDQNGDPLSQTLDIEGLLVSDTRLKMLARLGWVPADSRAAIKALPDFSVTVNVKGSGRRDAATGEQQAEGAVAFLWPNDAASIHVKGQYTSRHDLLKTTTTISCRSLGTDLVAALRPALAEFSPAMDAKLGEVLAAAPAFSTAVQIDATVSGHPTASDFAVDLARVQLTNFVATTKPARDNQKPLTVRGGLVAVLTQPPVSETAPAADAKPAVRPWTVEVKEVRLTDAGGKSWLPAGSQVSVRSTIDPVAESAAGPFTMTLPGGKAIAGNVSYDWTKGRLHVTDLNAAVDFDALDLANLSGPAAEFLRPLALKGSVLLAGTLDADTKAAPLADGLTYSLTFKARGLSAVNPKNGARSPARDLDATATRTSRGAAHEALVTSKHPQDGDLEAHVSYAADKLTVDTTLRQFVLSPQLVALGGPTAVACSPTGVLDGKVKATLSRDKLGRWIPDDMSGALTGKELAATDPGQELTFTGGSLKVTLDTAKIVVESFEGALAEGKLTHKSTLLPPVRDDAARSWRIEGGKQMAHRVALRQFKSLANRPANELDGRLTIDLWSKDDYGFAGPLDNLDKFTAKGRLAFGEGHLWQMPLFKLLQNSLFEGAAKLLRSQFDPSSFREAAGEFTVADGKLHLDGLTVDSDMVRLVIQGDVTLKGQLDLRIASSIRMNMGSKVTDLGGLIPGLGKEMEKIKGVLDQLPSGDLPITFGFFKVTGTYDQPVIAPDPEGSIQRFFGTTLEFLNRKNEAKAAPKTDPKTEAPAGPTTAPQPAR